jgi:hypothetical protein
MMLGAVITFVLATLIAASIAGRLGLRRGALLAGLTALALGVAAGGVLAGGLSWLSVLAGLAGAGTGIALVRRQD